jgi:methyl-accepting chemotaxis protein
VSNEVEIVVTAKDRAGPVTAKTAAQFRGLRGDIIKVGDELQKIDSKIDSTSEHVRQLGVEFEQTGNKDVLKKLREERGSLENLRRIRGELKQFADDAGKSGDEGGSKFRMNFGRGVLRGAGTFFGNVAESATTVLNRSFGTAVTSNPLVGAAFLAPVAAALVGGMPAIGSAAGGALVLGFGAGIAGIGLAAAAQNQAVQREFSALADYTKLVAKRISAPFVPMLLGLSSEFKETFDTFVPFLQEAFAKMAPAIGDFGTNVADGFSRMRFAIGPVTEAFSALLNTIGPSLPGLFEGLSDAIINVADSISSNPQTFANLVTWTIQLATGLTDLIAKLSDSANWLQQHGEAAKTLFSIATAGLGPLAAHALGIGKNAESARDASFAFQDAAAGMDQEKSAAEQLSESLDKLNSQNQSAEQAHLRFEESIDRVSEAIKKNGANLDSNTEKGRAVRGAMLQSAQAAVQFRDAQVKQGVPLDVANAKLSTQRDRLINAAAAAGMSKKAARLYVDTILQTPASKATAFRNNAASAKQEIITMGTLIKRLPSGKTFTFTVRTIITGPPKARIAFTTGGSGGFQREATGGVIGGGPMAQAAEGGPRGNVVMVGEQGPEMVRLPFGSTVRSNPDTRRIMGFASGGIAAQANSYLNWLRRGGTLHEDFSTSNPGWTNNGGRLADAFFASHRGYDYTGGAKDRAVISAWLRSKIPAARKPAAKPATLGQSAGSYLNWLNKGGALREDFSTSNRGWTGTGSKLADMFYKSHKGYNFTGGARDRNVVSTWLRTLMPAGKAAAPHTLNAAAATAGHAAGPMHVTVQLGGERVAQLLIDPLRKEVRTRGGDVQTVLGR